MSINSKLVTFAQQNLVLSYNDTERDKIESSIAHLEKLLRNNLGNEIKDTIRFGSYTRNTILPRAYDPNSDIDLMVVFDTSRNHYLPGTYRKWLHDLMEKTYPNSISKKDFPVVKLELNHIMFDLVPAYDTYSSWNGRTYYIPDVGDKWRITAPNDINPILTDKNKNVGTNLVRNSIRLCKHWNAKHGYQLESYLMEKDILNTVFGYDDDLYSGFLRVINRIAGSSVGVSLALQHIAQYKGSLYTPADEGKQLQWLQRLLPGLV